MRSSLLESVREFEATKAFSSFDLTETKYNISVLSVVEKEHVIVRINPPQKENPYNDEN
jgi:hypothetical protein